MCSCASLGRSEGVLEHGSGLERATRLVGSTCENRDSAKDNTLEALFGKFGPCSPWVDGRLDVRAVLAINLSEKCTHTMVAASCFESSPVVSRKTWRKCILPPELPHGGDAP
eukprot:11822168-Prorocentrum_lima.AAC.1